MRLPEAKQVEPLEKRFKIAPLALDFTKVSSCEISLVSSARVYSDSVSNVMIFL
jgi:hypothetical protein